MQRKLYYIYGFTLYDEFLFILSFSSTKSLCIYVTSRNFFIFFEVEMIFFSRERNFACKISLEIFFPINFKLCLLRHQQSCSKVAQREKLSAVTLKPNFLREIIVAHKLKLIWVPLRLGTQNSATRNLLTTYRTLLQLDQRVRRQILLLCHVSLSRHILQATQIDILAIIHVNCSPEGRQLLIHNFQATISLILLKTRR